MTVLALATFAGEGPYLRARLRLRADERRIVGEWMPYASEVLGKGEGEKGVRGVAAGAGGVAGAGLLALTAWSSAVAYPIDAGARPLLSWPAFLPAPIEFGALAAGIGAVVMLFRNAALTRLHHAAFDFDEVAAASRDAFVLAVACDAGEDANAVLATLAAAGAVHSRLVAG